jgi:hypothetical protein
LLKVAADENLNNNIVRGILRRKPDADIVRVQDAGLSGAHDPVVLEWAATENTVLLTHDVSTITRYAHERIKSGKHMPGVFEISRAVPIGKAIEDILLLIECSLEGEWSDQIQYSPSHGLQVSQSTRRPKSVGLEQSHRHLERTNLLPALDLTKSASIYIQTR